MEYWNEKFQDRKVMRPFQFIFERIDSITEDQPFLPVFLTRLGASNFQVGLLSSMPGMTGLVLAMLVGRFLQTRRDVVPL